jgi:hypothetical protein
MANKRLNAGHRDALKSLANKLIVSTADRGALDKAYAEAAKAVNALMVKLYPPADMAVLRKYGQATPDQCVFLSTGGSNYERFEFRADDPLIPVRPGSSRSCNHRTPHLLDEAQERAVKAHTDAKKAYEKDIAQRRKDFDTLIDSALTFEELVAVWPSADQLRERILGTSRAIAVMSAEVVERIRADAALTVELSE